MRGLWRLAIVAGLAAQAALAGDGVSDLSAAAGQWINAARAAEGRAPLTVSNALTRAAAAHARDMARHDRFSHAGQDGSTVGDRVRRERYGFCRVAENIAKGQGTLDEVLRGWMASPPHRRNLLDARVADFGLVRGEGRLWVMVLGRDGC